MYQTRSRFAICIGAQKAGTTWLSEQLRRHPEVSLPPRKEIRYFDLIHVHDFETIRTQRLRELRSRLNRVLVEKTELTPARVRDMRWHSNYAIVTREQCDDQWYWSLFASTDPEKLTGDFSPDYSLLPEQGVRHMKACAPQAKLFFVLRNPVDRIWSGAVYALRHIMEAGNRPSREEVRNAIGAKIQWNFSDYRHIIPRYEQFFGPQSINVLFYDQLLNAPLEFIESFCRMAGISFDPQWFSQFDSRVNEGPKLPRDAELIGEIARAQREQLEWLAARFGPVAEAWKRDAGF